jgi:hypothetical protein
MPVRKQLSDLRYVIRSPTVVSFSPIDSEMKSAHMAHVEDRAYRIAIGIGLVVDDKAPKSRLIRYSREPAIPLFGAEDHCGALGIINQISQTLIAFAARDPLVGIRSCQGRGGGRPRY